ncbi:MAG: hypothetical protein QMD77_00610 [Patescibacteria group bacterium]|nr:hypothetical protein [Patescibacteria group bacterium]
MAKIVEKKVVVPAEFDFPEGCKIPQGEIRDRFLYVAGEGGKEPMDLCGHRARQECSLCG